MLNALTSKGEQICLGDQYQKGVLLNFRRKESFICPVCKQKVIMKLGEKRVFHFSHLVSSNCEASYERESDFHLKGKIQLYNWLKKLGCTPVLEQYDSIIQQRPDIVFFYEGKKFALEYQCSPISVELFKKRTTVYERGGYIPLWILGGNQFKRKGESTVSLSDFHYLFLRDEGSIPFYCSNHQKFIFVSSLQSISPRNSLAVFTFQDIHNTFLNTVLNHRKTAPISIAQWRKSLQKYKLNLCCFPSRKDDTFFKSLYENSLNPHLLPPEIGIPVKSSSSIETAPLIWQAYVFLDLLKRGKQTQIVRHYDIKCFLQRRIYAKDIKVRELPLSRSQCPEEAVLNYLNLFVKMGYLAQPYQNNFRVQMGFEVPTTIDQLQHLEEQFYQAFQHFNQQP